ncbi:S8 family peptidase [Actinoplanes sp. CA-030573]|uniref:S8 family peptidase n=1 Tax=Actinoplanes sp. CA-030573 TaxID=3239898 RepID=UPI003D90F941
MIKILVPASRGEPDGYADHPEPGALSRFTLPLIPEALLERHGARVLRPSEAAVLPEQPRLSPTVYRYGVLLIPGNLISPDSAGTLNRLLEDLGVRLEPPPPLGDESGRLESFAELPRAVEIVPAGPFLARAVDAWTVLQRLRAGVVETARAAEEADDNDRDELRERAELVRKVVGATTLDHLLVGSAVDGGGSAGLVGANTASNGSPDLSDLLGRPAAGTSGRIPVTVALNDLDHPPKGDEATRRPVVAVLDSGIAFDPEHPWLQPLDQRAGAIDPNAAVIVDPSLQQRLTDEARRGGGVDGVPRLPIGDFRDLPPIAEPLLGDLSTHAGHGTFIAGLIRQLAPGAQIYAVRVMHPDGFAHEADLTFALTSIVAEVEQGTLPVDVVSLSLGYFHETDAERQVTANLEPLLRRLTAAGVIVVMAAGNFSTSREFYPAALTTVLDDPSAAPAISVGALNPNTSTARFSDEAPWVTCYASGAAVISSYPAFQGALEPPTGAGSRQSFDPDDFTSMFAVWSGTSFAAPVIAGCLAANLHPDAGQRDGDPAARAERARQAWTAVRTDPRYTVGREDDDR